MRTFRTNLISLVALCLLVLLAAGSMDAPQPTSGVYYEPKIVASKAGGFLSYDVTFQLDSLIRHSWIRTKQKLDDQTTSIDGTLKEVKLTLVCHYTQGGDRQDTVFWSEWKPGEKKVVNMPAPATLEGYDLKGTATVCDGTGAAVSTIKIELAFRNRKS